MDLAVAVAEQDLGNAGRARLGIADPNPVNAEGIVQVQHDRARRSHKLSGHGQGPSDPLLIGENLKLQPVVLNVKDLLRGVEFAARALCRRRLILLRKHIRLSEEDAERCPGHNMCEALDCRNHDGREDNLLAQVGHDWLGEPPLRRLLQCPPTDCNSAFAS